jgi:hypothetical protein
MYVLIAGVVDRIERNEAILFGRDGKQVGRFFKMAKTHPEQVPGDAAPVFETDFGRIACRICADEWVVELDRCYALEGADILLTPTQSWGPDALFRDLRDISRAMDGGMFVVECTHPSTEVRHRSMIVEPTGVVVARSEYRQDGVLSTADALRLAGGLIALSTSGSMTNATGQTIRGYGTLLEGGQTLDNQGLLEAVGSLVVGGAVTNSGNTIRADSAGDSVTIYGAFVIDGLVQLSGGASLSAATAGGAGQYSLQSATLAARADLTLPSSATVDDNGMAAAIRLQGNLTNLSTALGDFHVEHSDLTVFSLAIGGGAKHRILWLAEDHGVEGGGGEGPGALHEVEVHAGDAPGRLDFDLENAAHEVIVPRDLHLADRASRGQEEPARAQRRHRGRSERPRAHMPIIEAREPATGEAL